jgi:hypothetical protein
MPDAESVALVAAEWVARAEDDLKNAAHTLKLGRTCPTGTVCFHRLLHQFFRQPPIPPSMAPNRRRVRCLSASSRGQ